MSPDINIEPPPSLLTLLPSTPSPNRINQLQSVSNARMQNLRKWPTSEGVIKLVQIIRKDKAEAAEGKGSMFKMEVFEPPCLCVSVKQMEHASRVEATIPGALMRVSASIASIFVPGKGRRADSTRLSFVGTL